MSCAEHTNACTRTRLVAPPPPQPESATMKESVWEPSQTLAFARWMTRARCTPGPQKQALGSRWLVRRQGEPPRARPLLEAAILEAASVPPALFSRALRSIRRTACDDQDLKGRGKRASERGTNARVALMHSLTRMYVAFWSLEGRSKPARESADARPAVRTT